MSNSERVSGPLDGAAWGVVVALLAGLLATFGPGRASAADPDPAVLRTAHEMVMGEGVNKKNDTMVLNFAYPTSKSLTKVAYVRGEKFNDGSFDLIYQYNYRDNDNDPADFQLRFSFSAKGKVTDVRIVPGKHSSFWPPFSTADIALGVLKEVIRNDPKLKDDTVWKQVLTVDKATEALVLVMNIKAGK